MEVDMFKHVLVPFDFSKASERALDVAIEVATAHGARLTILHICEVPVYSYSELALSPIDLLTPIAKAGEERLKQLVRDTQVRFPGARGIFKVGDPSQVILDEVEAGGCDLISMGTHGRRGIAHVALGSVTEKIVRLSPVPVITVHAAASPGGR
jgi:nucleotide-binding universal stress UspA family protein